MDREKTFRGMMEVNYQRLEESIDANLQTGMNGPVSVEVCADIANVINSIVSYYETLPRKSCEDEETKQWMNAVRFVNNRLKHDERIAFVSARQGGFRQLGFPFVSKTPNVYWMQLHNLEPDRGSRTSFYDQRDAYRDLFEQRPVLKTLSHALELLGISVVNPLLARRAD